MLGIQKNISLFLGLILFLTATALTAEPDPNSHNWYTRQILIDRLMQYQGEFSYNDEEIDKLSKNTTSLLDSTGLDSFIVGTMDSQHIPGLSACIVKEGEILWSGHYGYANIEQGVEVGDSTLFMLASVSKTITGVAVMQLYEEGQFALECDINDYLSFNVENPNYPDSIITFRMLLTHTSSIRDNWFTLAFLTVQGDSPITLEDFLQDYLVQGGIYYSSASNYHNWPPGSEYDYCNVAVGLAGHLVETIGNTSFNQYCRVNIFEPLSMHETSWFLADLDTNKVALPYHWTGSRYMSYGHWGNPIYPSFQLRTSTLQLARFLIAIMQMGQIDGLRILDSTMVELMTTVQYPDIVSGQGLLWVNRDINGRSVWGHSGFILGVRTEMWFSPQEDIGVMVLTNGESDVLSVVNELFEFAAGCTEIAEGEDNPPLQRDLTKYLTYPNPFNSRVTVYFELAAPSDVNLEVYNIAGQEAASPISDKLPSGEHKYTFDAVDLPPGVYYFHLKTDFNCITQKTLLVR